MNPTEIKKQLEELGIRASKMRGQHFLIDSEVLDDILAAAELKKSDTVLEIGPGLGVLTRKLLLRAGRVVAVEIDQALAAHLAAVLGPHGLTVVERDAREIDIAQTLGEAADYKIVANIPYNITGEIFEKFFLLEKQAPRLMVLLVQREVARRVAAAPPRMSRLAVLLQYVGRPEIMRRVGRGAFWPEPKVESALLRVRRYPADVLARRRRMAPPELFLRMVQAGFSSPRKKLIGNFGALGFARNTLLSAFAKAKIEKDARAETVGIDQWLVLAEALLATSH